MRYKVEVMPRAVYDMRNVYHYIIHEFGEIDIADGLLSDLQSAIESLEILPYRCALRKTGRYAAWGHRQLFVKNFTIVYRVDEPLRRVLVDIHQVIFNNLKFSKFNVQDHSVEFSNLVKD